MYCWTILVFDDAEQYYLVEERENNSQRKFFFVETWDRNLFVTVQQ